MKLRQLGALCFIAFALVSGGCSPDESIPPDRSSTESTMDGSHSIPFSGAPDIVTHTRPIDSTLAPTGFSTAPVALFSPNGFAIGSRNGRVFIFNDHDSLSNTIDLGRENVVDQLVANSSVIIAITLAGEVSAYTPDAKALWHAYIAGMLTAPAILTKHSLNLAHDGEIVSLDLATGKTNWIYHSTLQTVALAYANDELVAGLSTGQSDMTDSIVTLDSHGSVSKHLALEGLRISSNIALCGENDATLAVGVLGEATGESRQSYVLAYATGNSSPQLLWKHPLPYLVLSVGANANSIVASGFRTGQTDVVSGADGFALADTSRMWSRRFTEPLASPVGVSDGNIYFTASFTSEAIVASRALFYTLSSGTGATVGERAIPGSNGFVAGMPIPDERGRFLIADRDKLVIYILDRSTLKRVF